MDPEDTFGVHPITMMKKRVLIICAAAVFFLLSLGVTLYPLISSFVNEKYRSEIHTAYTEELKNTDDSVLREAKEAAVRYNLSITPGTAASAMYSKEGLSVAAENYDTLLDLTGSGVMGYVRIPRIRVELPIYHGTGTDSLERGIGHLLGSSLPVGGENTHAVLTGHSGMASQRMFSDLTLLEAGDFFYLEVLDETLAYEVTQIHTVLPHETQHLGVREGEDLCTLITCTPFGVNTHRLLVTGHRIPYEHAQEIQEEAEEKPQDTTVSDWEEQYLLGVAIGLLAVLPGALLMALCILRKRRKAKYPSKS